ncbi:MAG TPA: glycoside hydrolase family 31 protein [Bacteroidales bacterium]|nr:glycoside hydrolase family 31 protein [Bacteroidales bacterium]HOK98574.1 glycoside hydrolase family 31 protein [Bacteroidales bacterium]HPO65831.1 glycoside hydrolase family 31 protein [Bacteroidales bacterium]
MRREAIVSLLMLWAVGVFAQQRISEQIGGVESVSVTERGVSITCSNARAIIQPYTDQIVRVRVVKNEFGPDFSYAVNMAPMATFTQVSDNDQEVVFSTSKVRLVVHKKPFYLSFYNQKGELINADDSLLRISWMGTEVTNYKKLFPDEKFIGLGEKTGGLNRRGSSYQNWNSDVPGYGLYQDPLYATIPFYIGIHSKLVYGIFLDNTYRTYFNFGASTDDQIMSFGAADGEMNYYFIAGDNVADIITNYTQLTGRSQLPPLWSLGYQQCRYSYFPDKDLLNIARTFREKQIPADVIYLDIHYMDNYKIFTFHPEYYPNPSATIAELKQLGFHTVVIVDPGLKIEKGYRPYEEGVKNNYFAKYPDGRDYIGSVWPGRSHFPDFTNPKVREWWGGFFEAYTKVGIMGTWNDMNEPAAWGQNIPNLIEFDYEGHRTTLAQARNVYGMQMARATYEGMRKLLPNTRFLNITRATYAGGQRYSTIWTGDNASYDDHMLLGVRLVNSLGVSGFPFAGPDVGGFVGEPSANLMIRWMNIGIFTPFLRNHVAYDRNHREPWVFGKEPEKIFRRLINLRYQLLPYLYSCAYEATQTGMPVNRTLAIDYTFDENIYNYNFENEFLFGPFMLVTPVVSTQYLAKVYLPEGKWYRFSTDEVYEQGTHLVEAPIDDMPVFVKGGAIIPMQSVIQHTQEANDGILYLHVYAGNAESSLVFYEDDGTTYNYQNGEYHKRLISYNPTKKEVTLSKAEGSFQSRYRQVKFILHGFGKVQKFTNKQGQPVNVTVGDKNVYEIMMPYGNDALGLTWK